MAHPGRDAARALGRIGVWANLDRLDATHLREFALSYPEAVEEYPWGHRAMKVKGKIFLTLGGTEQLATLSVKLPHSPRIATPWSPSSTASTVV